MRAFYLFLVLFFAPALFAESWTNTAGHFVEAKLIDRKGDVLTLKKRDGKVFMMQYSALSLASQARVDKRLPAPKKLTHNDVIRQRRKDRIRRLKLREKPCAEK